MRKLHILLIAIAFALTTHAQNGEWFASQFDSDGVQRGYRGFVDLTYGVGTGDFGQNHFDVTTVHGIQALPCLFVGAGTGLFYYPDAEVAGLPIFADFRTDMRNSHISPFFDLRVGYSIGDAVNGLYFNPSAGCRFGITRNLALNASIGYSTQRGEFDIWYDGTMTGYSVHKNMGAVDFRISLEF